MEYDIGEMIAPRLKGEPRVIRSVTDPLNRTVKIRRRGIGEKEMPDPVRNQTPAPDKGISQDERRVVPDKAILQRRPVNGECRHNDQENISGLFFQSLESCVHFRFVSSAHALSFKL